jgi:hypothetical protein
MVSHQPDVLENSAGIASFLREPTSLRPKTLFINFRLHWRQGG